MTKNNIIKEFNIYSTRKVFFSIEKTKKNVITCFLIIEEKNQINLKILL